MKNLIFLFAVLTATQVNAGFVYQSVGTGHCADSTSMQKLPFFRVGGIGEDVCIARCDGDNACLGYTYDGTDCLNFYGTTRLFVTWDPIWEEGPTTAFESTTIDGLWTGFGDSSAVCMKKLDYLNKGQGTCADENGVPLNWARITLAEENQCRSRCDLDVACFGYRYQGNLCHNFFGLVGLNAHSDWTTVKSDNTHNPAKVTSFGNTGFCIAKSMYESVGGGACADINLDLLPVARKLTTLSNKDCRERCDVDAACLGFRYVQNLCYNVFADEPLTAFTDWDLVDQPSTSPGGIAQSKHYTGICMRKKAFPTPLPTSQPTESPTLSPTFPPVESCVDNWPLHIYPTSCSWLVANEGCDWPLKNLNFGPNVYFSGQELVSTFCQDSCGCQTSCKRFGRGSEFRFTWQRRCVNGWSSTCANGLVFFDLNGQEIDLAAYNPTITDTGFWRSGAHSYVGAEIVKNVGFAYCSEPLRCDAATQFDDEVLNIVLDQEIEFSSFDLQQVDKLYYQGDWTFEIKNGGNWELLVSNNIDFGVKEVRKFGYNCDCSINGFWHPETYTYVQGVTKGIVSNFPSPHGPGTGTMNQDGSVRWIWHNTGAEHRGVFSDDCAIITWENTKQWFRSTDAAVRTQIDAKGWTESQFRANKDAFTALLATELGIPESSIVVSLQNIGWMRRMLSEVLSIEVYISPSESDFDRVTSILKDSTTLVESLKARFGISFDVRAVDYIIPLTEDSENTETKVKVSEEVSLLVFLVGVFSALFVGVLFGSCSMFAFYKSSSTESSAVTADLETGKRKAQTKDIALEH